MFRQLLNAIRDRPVLISIHSMGATSEVLGELAGAPHPGAILHWFLGTPSQVARAASIGCFFSVNAAMGDDLVTAMPKERVLSETDYPETKLRDGGRLPDGR